MHLPDSPVDRERSRPSWRPAQLGRGQRLTFGKRCHPWQVSLASRHLVASRAWMRRFTDVLQRLELAGAFDSSLKTTARHPSGPSISFVRSPIYGGSPQSQHRTSSNFDGFQMHQVAHLLGICGISASLSWLEQFITKTAYSHSLSFILLAIDQRGEAQESMPSTVLLRLESMI